MVSPSNVLTLPKWVFEEHLLHLVAKLAQADSQANPVVDFGQVKYYIPAGIVAVASRLRKWSDQGKKFSLEGLENPVMQYFHRMNFFASMGLNIPESFQRHESANFVPLNEVSEKSGKTEELAVAMAKCISPNQEPDDIFRIIEYASSEIILNCKQHSKGVGFISAQYAQKHDFARIAIADNGIGILESFKSTESPHYRPGMTDASAIQLSIQPEVSSKTHLKHPYGHSPNRGVGLSMLQQLVHQTFGFMIVVSGRGVLFQDGRKPPIIRTLPEDANFTGTLCSAAFKRKEVDNYGQMLKEARIALGLQPPEDTAKLFV
jgi:hypothetical protein